MESAAKPIGLNAANFFLAEVVGVIMPFLNDFLKESGWRYDAIGIATAVGGLAVFLVQTPAGVIVDRAVHRRVLLAAASLLLGVSYGLIVCLPPTGGSSTRSCSRPGRDRRSSRRCWQALALGLVGHVAISKTVGMNQGWNHAGNIAAALSAMILVNWSSLSSVFRGHNHIHSGRRLGIYYPPWRTRRASAHPDNKRMGMARRIRSACTGY